MSQAMCHLHDDHCRFYRAGHSVHFIQARLVGESPWGWRDAIVEACHNDTIRVRYIHEDAVVTCWHHHDLRGVVEVGAPVRLHERFHVLGTPTGWYSVFISGGLGAVPVPDHPELWSGQAVPGIVNLATGVALATDRPGTER